MKRIELFNKALIESKDAYARAPYMFPLRSVITQLEYLIAFESGEESVKGDLASINIGEVAARDLDNFDPPLASLLHDVSAEVRKMSID